MCVTLYWWLTTRCFHTAAGVGSLNLGPPAYLAAIPPNAIPTLHNFAPTPRGPALLVRPPVLPAGVTRLLGV